MTISSLEQAFVEFESTVARVPDDDNTSAKEVHPQIRQAVASELSVETHFLSGSYGRKTQAKSLKDVDIIVVLKDDDGAYFRSASDTLEAVRKAAKTSELVKPAHVSVRAVKCFLPDYDFHVDLVPALRRTASGLYLTRNLPEEGYDDWTLEDPEAQKKASGDKNKETDGRHIRLVRIIKAWNQRYEKKPLRSYHAEALVHLSHTKGMDYAEAVTAFFDTAYDRLAPGQKTPTPGCPGRYVDDRLKDDDRAEARDRVAKARTHIHAAVAETDPAKAMEHYVKVFGSGFPAPSTNSDVVAKALAEGTARATGAGLTTNPSPGTRPVTSGRSWRRD
jgi:hypothetical protein